MTDLRSYADDDLVGMLADKDPDALEALYDRHSKPVFSLALRMLGDVTIAEEVVQDVFLKLWRNPERFVAGRGSLRSWLLSVTHNRTIDTIRSRRNEMLHRGGDAEFERALEIQDHDPEPADLAWLSVQLDGVRKALSTLPEHQRQVIELAYFRGMTHAEIAAHLQQPLGTVKTWVRQGIQRLRERLEAEHLGAVMS